MEPRAPTTDPPGHGGMIVMVRPDPAESARALAHDLHAELVLGGDAALQLMNRLDAETPRHRPAIDLAGRPVDAALDDLTVAMRRAEAVRDATRARTAQRLAATFNTRMAIHPDTLRRAASELIAVRRALDTHAEAATRAAGYRRRSIAAGAVVLALAIGGAVAYEMGGVTVATVLLAGTAIVALVTMTALRLASRSARPTSDLAELRLAEGPATRRWTQVAPAGTPPEAVDDVIHRYEPQHRVVADLIGEHPAVRAAERAAVARRMAWVGAWREALGDDAPLATGPQAHRLQADVLRHVDAEVVLTDPPLTGGILVVASPYDGLTDADALRLHRHLLDPPGGRRVIVILPPDPDLPSAAHLPGTGWISAE